MSAGCCILLDVLIYVDKILPSLYILSLPYTIFAKWFCHMSSLQSISQNKYDMATEIDDMVSRKIWHG